MLIGTQKNISAEQTTGSMKCTSAGELIAFLIVILAFSILSVATLFFWAGVPVGPFQLWLALILTLVIGRYLAANSRVWLIAIVWLAFATLGGGAVLGWFYDFSGDGQWYHLPGIMALAEGWNPFLTPRLDEWNTGFEQDLANAAIYVQHYAKGPWITAAVVYKTTGLLEATKVFNLLFMVAAYLLAAAYLGRVGLSRIWAHTLAFVAAFNPVSIYQAASFFVDGQLASICTLLVVLSLEYFRQPRPRTLALLAACVVILVNIKFTGVVYAATLGIGFTVLALLKGLRAESGRYAAAGFISVLIALFVIGYQPYATNFLQKGNPFYPAVDRDEEANIATEGQFDRWAPPEFLSMGRVEKMTRSLLAESSAATDMPRWKLPFSITKQELYIFFNTEPRYGGFGPLFGWTFLVTLVIYALAVKAGVRKVWAAGAALALLVMSSVLPNPEAWWARLAPQLWLAPVILLAAIAIGVSGWQRRAAAILVMLLLVNSVMVAALNWGRAVEKSLVYREQLARLQQISSTGSLEIAADPRFRMVTEYRLQAHAIPYHRADEPSCTDPYRFSYPNNPARAQAAACPDS